MSILEKRSIYREYIEHREKKAVFLRATAFFLQEQKKRTERSFRGIYYSKSYLKAENNLQKRPLYCLKKLSKPTPGARWWWEGGGYRNLRNCFCCCQHVFIWRPPEIEVGISSLTFTYRYSLEFSDTIKGTFGTYRGPKKDLAKLNIKTWENLKTTRKAKPSICKRFKDVSIQVGQIETLQNLTLLDRLKFQHSALSATLKRFFSHL